MQAFLLPQNAVAETESFVLFVDAFRYELAEEFCKRLAKYKLKVSLQAGWSAIPSLTPTAKRNVSPIATAISIQSGIAEFRPQLQNGKDLLTPVFRDALKTADFKLVTNANDIQGEGKYWQEIGDIDTKGHEEQADMVKRIEELFDQVQEALDVAFERGIKRIKIVTDHGWLYYREVYLNPTQCRVNRNPLGSLCINQRRGNYRFAASALAMEPIHLYCLCSRHFIFQSKRRVRSRRYFDT
ncbi:MAG: PglZ domain-containing protein [Saprospiraceae bacterium]|nr:PglZ domain-containing protein [Saprospiraceae bacterium]